MSYYVRIEHCETGAEFFLTRRRSIPRCSQNELSSSRCYAVQFHTELDAVKAARKYIKTAPVQHSVYVERYENFLIRRGRT